MAKKPETIICERIIHSIRSAGGFAIHVPGSIKQANQPDLDGSVFDDVGQPVHFKIEVKQPGEEARKAQQAMMNVWAHHGYLTGTVSDVTEFWLLINKEIYSRRIKRKYEQAQKA